MNHIEQRPYQEDPVREFDNPVNEQEELKKVVDSCRRDGYFVKQGHRIVGKNKQGETVFFVDEDAMRKCYADYDEIVKLLRREEERSPGQIPDVEREMNAVEQGYDDAEKVYYEEAEDPFLSDSALGEDKERGH